MSETVDPVATGDSPLPGLIAALPRLDPDCDDAVRIDQIRQLEELKSAAAAAQARMTAAFVASQRGANRAAGVKPEHAERGIARQVGLARRISPFHARRYVGWATILTAELPHTFAGLSAGRTSEWRAMMVARETDWLSRDHPGPAGAFTMTTPTGHTYQSRAPVLIHRTRRTPIRVVQSPGSARALGVPPACGGELAADVSRSTPFCGVVGNDTARINFARIYNGMLP